MPRFCALIGLLIFPSLLTPEAEAKGLNKFKKLEKELIQNRKTEKTKLEEKPTTEETRSEISLSLENRLTLSLQIGLFSARHKAKDLNASGATRLQLSYDLKNFSFGDYPIQLIYSFTSSDIAPPLNKDNMEIEYLGIIEIHSVGIASTMMLGSAFLQVEGLLGYPILHLQNQTGLASDEPPSLAGLLAVLGVESRWKVSDKVFLGLGYQLGFGAFSTHEIYLGTTFVF